MSFNGVVAEAQMTHRTLPLLEARAGLGIPNLTQLQAMWKSLFPCTTYRVESAPRCHWHPHIFTIIVTISLIRAGRGSRICS